MLFGVTMTYSILKMKCVALAVRLQKHSKKKKLHNDLLSKNCLLYILIALHHFIQTGVYLYHRDVQHDAY